MLDVGTSMQIGVQIWQPFRPEADPVQIGVARRVSLLPLGGQLPISRVGSQTPCLGGDEGKDRRASSLGRGTIFEKDRRKR